jgi:hypothetical protein
MKKTVMIVMTIVIKYTNEDNIKDIVQFLDALCAYIKIKNKYGSDIPWKTENSLIYEIDNKYDKESLEQSLSEKILELKLHTLHFFINY